MTILVILFLALGVLGALIALPPSAALFFFGASRVRDSAIYYAYTGLIMLMISVVGLLWVALK